MSSVTNGQSDDCCEAKKARQSSELEQFDSLFPDIVADLTQDVTSRKEIQFALDWFKQVLEYNVPFGKKNRGLTVLQSYKSLMEGEEVGENDLLIARVLGWCIEMLQAFFLVCDDIMDHSETRRGKACWYKQNGVGLIAINDAIYIESAIYFLLKKYCKNKPYYVEVMEAFHEVTLQTIVGQNLDTCTPPADGSVDFTHYTMHRYQAIVKWKTAYYSFYLPVALAMYMAGIKDEVSHGNAKLILLRMGEYFQIQDDYLDCYGDPEVTGKVGTDIQDNKCSWLVIQALQRASPQQIQILKENYAKWESEKVAAVKKVFNDLDLDKAYREYEESSYQQLRRDIEQYSGDLPKDMFVAFANKIYKRQK